MQYEGNLRKMNAEYAVPVKYALRLGEQVVDMNALIGQTLKIRFDGRINCINCDRVTKKAFGQGFCYPCFINSPTNSECIIRPELCQGHEGGGRDPEWEQEHHVQPHYVYLALTSGVKVGVTRLGNTPHRWINQGAWKVIRFAETPYRQLAGEIEVYLKEFVTDKTHWQKMLKDVRKDEVDLVDEKEMLLDELPEELGQYFSEDDDVMEFVYPVTQYPEKVKSLNLDKTPEIEGELAGIRGQYLIFDGGRVMNVRRFSGYYVTLEV
ncbi:MAG: DUF2797 domain-containing protein [Bacteroidota bacterium]